MTWRRFFTLWREAFRRWHLNGPGKYGYLKGRPQPYDDRSGRWAS